MSDQTPESEIKSHRRFHKTRKVFGVSFSVLMEGFLIILLLVLLAGGVLFYKLSKDELNVEFAKERLEKRINAEIAPYHIKTTELDIDWPNIFERPVFRVKNFVFLNPENEALLTLDDLSFTFSRSRILIGEFFPREVKAKGLDLHFVKKADGSVQLGFVAGPSLVLYDGYMTAEGRKLVSMDEIYQQHLAPLFEEGFLSGLRTFQISNSSIVFEDLEKEYALTFPDVDASMKPNDQSISLDLDVDVQNGAVKDNLQANALYDIKFRELQTSIQTENFNPFLWASLFEIEQINSEASSVSITSSTQLVFDDRFNLQSAEVESIAENGKLDIPVLYDHSVEFEQLDLNAFFNRQNLTIDLKDSVLEAYGTKIGLEASLPILSDEITEYEIPLRLNIPEVEVPIPEESFPDKFEDKPIYEWLTEKLQTGTIKNFEMDLVLSLFKKEDESWGGDLKKLISEFEFEDLTADYKGSMTPLSNISGKGTIDSGPDTMTITAPSGNFDEIVLRDINIGLVDVLAKKKSTVTLDFNAQGSLRDVFDYLADDPINIKEKVKFDTSAVEGTADLHVWLQTKTKKKIPLDEIKIDIEGKLQNILVPKLVRELDVSSDYADLTIKDGLITIKGEGRLSGRETEFSWQQYIKGEGKPFKMKVDANLTADANLRRYFDVKIDDFLSGSTGIDLVYTSYPDKTAVINISADLTPAQIHIDSLGYLKPSGESGKVTLNARLRNNKVQSVSNMNIAAKDLSVLNAELFFQNGNIKSGNFPSNRIGVSDAAMEMTFEGKQSVTLDIQGQRLDARSVLAKKDKQEKKDGPAIRSYVEVDELLTHESEMVKEAKVFVNMLPNSDISQFEMDGKSGNGGVYIRYKPGPDGSPNLRAEFGDAGSALRAFGLYQNARGGELVVTGTSADRVWKGNVTGNFLMRNFAVRDAPVLAKLINAMSLPGLAQLMGNDGIVFSKLTADFEWTSRPEGSLITVSDGRTSGSELGLTFEGLINRANNTLNMEGTIVPVSTLNKLIGDIPVLGPVITGGTGSLIAATYKIKGPYHNAEVRINPLSALAPGIVRKLLFED